MIVRWGLSQGGKIGRLVRLNLIERNTEIVQRSRGHAVAAVPEIDFIEIELENVVLREHILHPPRDQHLFDLPVHALIRGQEEVLRDLLGDGRRAFKP